MRRLGIHIANAALFVLCCYAAAGLFNKISSKVLAPLAEIPGVAVAEAPEPTAPSASRTLDINKRNLFGVTVSFDSATAEPEPDPEPAAVVTKLPLMLIGTAAFQADVDSSRAAIADRGGNDPEILAIGDALQAHPQVIVAAITAREVILDNAGSREILRLDDEEKGRKPRAKPRGGKGGKKPKRASRASRRSRGGKGAQRGASKGSKLAENLKRLADQNLAGDGIAELLAQRGGGVAKLLSQAQILPKYENGKMVGIELSDIKDGSFYEQIGLRDGDVISEVNGNKISSPTASQEVITGLRASPEFVAIVNGRPFTVPADKIAELMESGVLGP